MAFIAIPEVNEQQARQHAMAVLAVSEWCRMLAGSEDGAAAEGEQRAGRSRRSTRKVTDFALLNEGNTRELTPKVRMPPLHCTLALYIELAGAVSSAGCTVYIL